MCGTFTKIYCTLCHKANLTKLERNEISDMFSDVSDDKLEINSR